MVIANFLIIAGIFTFLGWFFAQKGDIVIDITKIQLFFEKFKTKN